LQPCSAPSISAAEQPLIVLAITTNNLMMRIATGITAWPMRDRIGNTVTWIGLL
jgi:hypothetical protein